MSESAPTSESNQTDRIKFPGFGLPLDEYRDEDPRTIGFANALGFPDDAEVPMIPIREFTMMRLMNEMTDKEGWEQKVLDLEIAAEWKEEAIERPNLDITEAMVDWCIAEVQHKSQVLKTTNSVIVFTGDVVKSDTIVPESTRLALIEAVKPLEDVPDRLMDWDPDSNKIVLDLVHPSLWPLIFGKTRVLPSGGTTLDDCIALCGAGERIGQPTCSPDSIYRHVYEDFEYHKPYNLEFQWLPCQVDVSNGQTKITSYISNLHPEHHKPLYGLIEQIIACAIPLWDLTLTPQRRGYDHRIKYDQCEYDPPRPEEGQDLDEWLETREVIRPDVGSFILVELSEEETWEIGSNGKRYMKERVDIRKEFGEDGIQVIVKLMNIVLTPDKPRYGRGLWHVEGQLNEHICATAVYYYASSNITTSQLSFRHRVTTEYNVTHKEDETEWLPEVFGIKEGGSPLQFIGSVDTRQGRLVTSPNHFQNIFKPFQLEDPTLPGFQKILVLFLVDPQTPILSTKNVPCQRLDWWSDLIRQPKPSGGRHDTSVARDRLSSLPVEIQDHIFRWVTDFPISMERAKQTKLALTAERSAFGDSQHAMYVDARFSLGKRSNTSETESDSDLDSDSA